MRIKVLDEHPPLAGRLGRLALRRLGLHPQDHEPARFDLAGTRALCIATNHGVLDLGIATGVYASELSVPFYGFLDAGMAVDVASPRGGPVPVDPLSLRPGLRTPEDDRLIGDARLRQQLSESLAIETLDFRGYEIVYLAGGWGAAFDLGQSEALGVRMSEAWAAGRVIGGICHGPLGLLRARGSDGELLVKGRRLTAVTDRQLRQLGVAITPLHPESALRAAGVCFESRRHPLADFFANHYVVDGDLITGQNQNAGPMVARLMMQRVLDQRRGH